MINTILTCQDRLTLGNAETELRPLLEIARMFVDRNGERVEVLNG
jgi:hypothetical protein